MTKVVQCPTCGKQVKWSDVSPWRPFCSERCRLIDLGAWANEEYRVPGEPTDEVEHDRDEENLSQD